MAQQHRCRRRRGATQAGAEPACFVWPLWGYFCISLHLCDALCYVCFMSRPVRIRGDVVAQVEAVALGERRSLANMVEVLLLAALAGRDQGAEGSGRQAGLSRAVVSGVGGSTESHSSPAPSSSRPASADVAATVPGVMVGVRAHMRGDRPMLECSERVASGVCPKCGRVL